jgi:hypothetical protein
MILLVLLLSCSKDSITNPKPNPNSDPISVIFINCIPERITYYSPHIPTYVPLSINNISGNIFSDPISEIYSISVLDTVGEQERLTQEINDDGSVYFRQNFGIKDPPRTVNCQIETSVGSFTGIEDIPSQISDLRIVNGNNIVWGDSLKIDWKAENTSFFGFSLYIRYNKTSGWERYLIPTTLIFHESITLSPDLLYKVFESTSTEFRYTIFQYNGPLPVVGSQTNMDQENKGYLYCSLGATRINFEILNDGSIVKIDSSLLKNHQVEDTVVNQKIIERLFGNSKYGKK